MQEGFTKYVTPNGVEVFSRVPMTADELLELDYDMANSPEYDEDYYEDPDADGYGWERKALRGIY